MSVWGSTDEPEHLDAAAAGPRPLRVQLIDDDELVCAGLAAMLAPYADRVVLAGDEEAAAIILVDPFGTAGAGLNTLRDRTARSPGQRVVVFTYRRDPRLIDAALAAGAAGFLTKGEPAEQLVADLERVAAGETVVPEAAPDDSTSALAQRWSLTEREGDVATLLAQGLRNADIAAALHISPNTVKTHLRALFRKLGAATRSQAVALVLATDGGGHGEGGGGREHRNGYGRPEPATSNEASDLRPAL